MDTKINCDYLLVCATDIERESLISEAVKDVSIPGDKNYYYDLGKIGNKKIVLVQCQMGVTGALTVINEAIKECNPKYIIMAGIVCGMKPSTQCIGQILVAEQCKGYDPERIGQTPQGALIAIDRGNKIPDSQKILNIFRVASRKIMPSPIFGLILSGSKLIDNITFREELKNTEPEAIGADMETYALASAAIEAGIPWGSAKAICDFADGQKGENKTEKQQIAAKASAQFVFKAIRLSEGILPELSFLEKIQKYGLVDLDLHRSGLSWPYLTKNLDDLIDQMPPKSEFFIVARSLEMWINPRIGEKTTYLEKLAKKVVADRLRCIFVLPDDDPDLKSLVLSDPSQRFQADLWQRITTPLKNIIEEGSRNRHDDDPDYGFVEIYTIPAYVPSTFSKISTRDGIEYCSLEVGIGVPPGEARVYLYFEKKENTHGIYERLCVIYKNIIAERKPKYKFPSWKNKPPEDPAILSKRYNSMKDEFLSEGFHFLHCTDNKDWYASVDKIHNGQAACITTLPLAKYIGGKQLLDSIAALRKEITDIISRFPNEETKISWTDNNDLNIPVFSYKNSFSEGFPSVKSSESEDIISCISAHSPIHIEFKYFVIDIFGTIMFLGVPSVPDNINMMSALRDDLLELAKIKYKRYEAKRPQDISCVIGVLKNDLDNNLLNALQEFTERRYHLPTPLDIEVDQVRLVKLEGTYSEHTIVNILPSIILKTELLERDRFEKYGVITTGKWLAHPLVVNKVKSNAFDTITPVNAHFSPSLKCIYHCPICSYGASKEHPKAKNISMMLRRDMFSSIDKLHKAGLKGLIFTGGGEPLMNKSTPEAIRYAKQSGLSVGLFTNGYLLTSKIAEYLLSDNNAPDFIRFSINAGTSEAYRLIHGSHPDSFEIVLKNLDVLCRTKYNTRVNTNIDVGVLVTPLILDNLIDLSIETKRIALKHPNTLNSVLFRPAVRYRNGCMNNSFAKELMSHSNYGSTFKNFIKKNKQFDFTDFEKAIATIESQVRPLLINQGDPSSRVNVSLPETRFKKINLEHPFNQCLACNMVIFVAPDTSVYRCVEQALDPYLNMGRLKDVSSLQDLWKEDILEKTAPRPGQCPPVCSLFETNLAWDDIVKSYKDNSVKLDHQIDLAKEYFDKHVLPRIGKLSDFI